MKQMKQSMTATIAGKLSPKKAIACTYLCMSAMSMNVFASGTVSVTTGDVDANDMMNKVVTLLLTMMRFVGVLLLIWSIFQLVSAFKNEDADSKSRAMMMVMVGVILIGIKSVIRTLGIIS